MELHKPSAGADGASDLTPPTDEVASVPIASSVPVAAIEDGDGAWAVLTAVAVVLAEAPVWRLGDETLVERVRELEGVRARLEAHRLTLLRELDERPWAARVGAVSTASWLAHAVRCGAVRPADGGRGPPGGAGAGPGWRGAPGTGGADAHRRAPLRR
jgi:hypothetical protein